MGNHRIESEQFLHSAQQPLPVLLVEGAFAPELSLVPLQRTLQREGYQAYLLHKSIPFNHVVRVEQAVDDRVDEITQAHQGPVVIIGHSLGGTFAARKIQRDPEQVAGIFAIAGLVNNPGDVYTSPWLIRGLASDIEIPEGKPAIGIYSPLDMVIPPFLSVNPTFSEHIKIWTLLPQIAHQAIIFHPKTRRIIKDRLPHMNSAVSLTQGNKSQPAVAKVG